ncbi:AAA family ATPase [Nocardioides sp.]|uniref:AAA family ATPase n=1 Tax=Nocardioides sp. TaxID=35761 RepID=UPI00286DCC30|nr:AAA family ATPase [Nocardioides sp.]
MTDPGDQEFRTSLARLVKQLLKEDESPKRGTPLLPILDEHLGSPADEMPVVFERIDVHRWADVDIALEAIVARDPHARLVGVGGGDRHHMSLSDLMANAEWGRFRQGQVDRLSVAIGPDSERATIAFGLHLFRYGDEPVLVLQRGHNPQHGGEARVEVVTSKPEVASRLLAELRELSLEKSVLRGQVISFSGNPYEHSMSGITFSRRPDLTADRVILPAGTLEQVRSHVVGLAEHREQLRAMGQHLKRGILLYGPPGTGKTHTVRHLIGAVPETTVILLSGTNLVHVGSAAQIARAHQPAIVVLEDCDLIAEDRDHGQLGGGASPLLFTLLDAMDGLDQDADVVFLLTTNRVEALEHALAQRPGRVDLAVEIPLPDAGARRALIGLYAAEVGFGEDAITAAADEAEGTTASYAKELVRRAVLHAAMAGHQPTGDDLVAASQELRADSAVLTRALLGSQ